MKPLPKKRLKGKHVGFIDKDGKFRVNKVVRITGNLLTVKDALGIKRRIHLKNVLGRIIRKTKLQKISFKKNIKQR